MEDVLFYDRFVALRPASLTLALVACATCVGAPSAGDAAIAAVVAQATSDARATPTPAPPSDPCGGPGRLLATLDRPTVGFSSCTVPAGEFVSEDGYQVQTQATAPQSAVTFPIGFQRIGVAERFEVDLVGPNFNRVRSDASLATGASDVGLGFKAEFPSRGRFTYAIDGLYTPATGTGGFGAGGPTQTVNADIAFAASPAIGVATTIAFASSAGTYAALPSVASGNSDTHAERFGFVGPSLVVTAQLPQYFQFYVELFGQTKLGPHQGGRVALDGGLQKLIGPDLELDAEYGTSFTPIGGSRFHYVGLGTGIRVR